MDKEVGYVLLVAGVIIEQDGKYLMVQEKMPSVYGLWNLPAGKVDKGGTIEQTAVKEAKEETGYDVELLEKIGIIPQENASAPVRHIFEAKIIGGKLEYPKDEILDVRWFSWEEIQSMKDKLRKPWIMEVLETYRRIKRKT